jgi:hypothetical protein
LAEFKKILQAGKKLLAEGRTAVEVAEEVTCLLEDCPWFNAGKGSVFTNSGTQEMDASIMDGSTLNAGACAAVCTIKNPIKLARVSTKTSHTRNNHSPFIQPFDSELSRLYNPPAPHARALMVFGIRRHKVHHPRQHATLLDWI